MDEQPSAAEPEPELIESEPQPAYLLTADERRDLRAKGMLPPSVRTMINLHQRSIT